MNIKQPKYIFSALALAVVVGLRVCEDFREMLLV